MSLAAAANQPPHNCHEAPMPLFDAGWYAAYTARNAKRQKRMRWKIVWRSKGRGRGKRAKWVLR